MRPPPAPPLGRTGEFYYPYVVKPGPQITVFYVCGERVLGVPNSLSSLAGCGPHVSIVVLSGGMPRASVAWCC